MCNSLVLLLFWSSVNVNLQNRVDWITRNECDWTCSFGWFVVGVGCSYSFSLSGNLVLNSASVKSEGVRCGSRGCHFHSHRIGLTCHSIQAMWKCISTSCHSIKLGLLAASSPYMRCHIESLLCSLTTFLCFYRWLLHLKKHGDHELLCTLLGYCNMHYWKLSVDE